MGKAWRAPFGNRHQRMGEKWSKNARGSDMAREGDGECTSELVCERLDLRLRDCHAAPRRHRRTPCPRRVGVGHVRGSCVDRKLLIL